MLAFPAPVSPKRREPKKPKKTKPLVAGLTLVSASFDPSSSILLLTFDRAINIDGLDGQEISVNDPVTSASLLQATAWGGLLGPNTAQLGMNSVDVATGTQVLLSASAVNGIVDSDSGTEWAGVTDWVI